MDFTHLNKILERSFAHVKEDILKIKESMLELAQKASDVKQDASKSKEVDNLTLELVKLRNEVRQLRADSAVKKEVNAKMLTLYRGLKRKDEAQTQIKTLNKSYEKTLQNQMLILKKIKLIEDSKLNFDELKNTFVQTAKFDNEQKNSKELSSNLKKMQAKLDKVENNAASSMLDVKKNFETIVLEINRLDSETVKTGEAGKVKARIARIEKKFKDLKPKKIEVKKPAVKKISIRKPAVKKAPVKKVQVKKEVKQTTKKPDAPKPSSEPEDGKLFKKAIGSVIDYFTEVPETEIMKPAPKQSRKPAGGKKSEKK